MATSFLTSTNLGGFTTRVGGDGILREEVKNEAGGAGTLGKGHRKRVAHKGVLQRRSPVEVGVTASHVPYPRRSSA
jgi:hypothetical protein